jgi:hypothetical protein
MEQKTDEWIDKCKYCGKKMRSTISQNQLDSNIKSHEKVCMFKPVKEKK